jgi:uncharacterized membrane protein (DUF373 family)
VTSAALQNVTRELLLHASLSRIHRHEDAAALNMLLVILGVLATYVMVRQHAG